MAKSLKTNDLLSRTKLEELIEIEGLPVDPGIGGFYPVTYPFDGNASPATSGATAGNITSSFSAAVSKPPLTKRYLVDNCYVWTSEPLYLRIEGGGTNNIWQGVVNGNLHLPIKHFVQPNMAVGMNIKGRVNASTGGTVATFSARGITASADVEYSAPYTMMIIADSNAEGTSSEFSTNMWDIYTWQTKRNFANAGKRVRLIDKSKAGYTTQDFETFRLNGRWELPYQPSVIVWALGTNDPGRIIDSGSTGYTAYLSNAIAYKQWRYPDSHLIIVGALVNGESTTKQGVLAGQRTTAQTLIANANAGVSSASTQYIHYCNFGDLWDATSGLNSSGTQCFTSSGIDSNGKIHGNIYGQLLMGQRLWSVIQSANIVNTMLPSY